MKKSISISLICMVLLLALTPVGAETQPVLNFVQSDRYIKYTELSEEEKADTLIPLPFEVQTYADLGTAAAELPSKYDLREDGDVTSVKDQNPYNVCWTFANNGALESYLLKNENVEYDFSEKHVTYSVSNAFIDGNNPWAIPGRVPNQGGNVLAYASYAFAGMGPVLDGSMPYTNIGENLYLADIKDALLAGPQLRDFAFLTSASDMQTTPDEITLLKQHLYDYGALSVGIMAPEDYYTEAYYNYTDEQNHAVLIVGWDDEYSKTNFENVPPGDGAWIVKNSWSENAHDDGYFYMSYYQPVHDTAVIEDASTEKFYDNLYYKTENMANVGYIPNSLPYIANVFDKTPGAQSLTEITVQSLAAMDYEVYVNPDATQKMINDGIFDLCYASGRFEHAGFNTIKLNMPVPLTADKFTVVVKCTTPGNVESSPYPIISPLDKTDMGMGMVSYDGSYWIDVLGEKPYTQGFDCGIYAYTEDVEPKALVAFQTDPYYAVTEVCDGTVTYQERQGGEYSLLPGEYTVLAATPTEPGNSFRKMHFVVREEDTAGGLFIRLEPEKPLYEMALDLSKNSLPAEETLGITASMQMTDASIYDMMIVAVYNSAGKMKHMFAYDYREWSVLEGEAYYKTLSADIAPGDKVKAFVIDWLSARPISKIAEKTVVKQ